MRKIVVSVGVVMLGLGALAATSEGRPTTFQNRDLRGRYGILERGWLEGMNWSEVGIISADGNGHATIEFVGTLGGTIPITAYLTCDYEVFSNGMGEMTCVSDEVGESAIDFVLVDRGNELRFTTKPTPDGGQSMGSARRQ